VNDKHSTPGLVIDMEQDMDSVTRDTAGAGSQGQLLHSGHVCIQAALQTSMTPGTCPDQAVP
jgi:hypothetical protein